MGVLKIGNVSAAIPTPKTAVMKMRERPCSLEIITWSGKRRLRHINFWSAQVLYQREIRQSTVQITKKRVYNFAWKS
jgi:hypothetical protein